MAKNKTMEARNFSAANMTLESCKKSFTDALKATKRPGVDKLLDFLEKRKFFSAPAGSEFGVEHENREGGALRHAMNVYTRILLLLSQEKTLFTGDGDNVAKDLFNSEEMLTGAVIVSLLHDICDVSCIGYGHGEESVYVLSGFMKLTREECFAIRYHGEDTPEARAAFAKYPLALLLHNAEEQAIFFDEAVEK